MHRYSKTARTSLLAALAVSANAWADAFMTASHMRRLNLVTTAQQISTLRTLRRVHGVTNCRGGSDADAFMVSQTVEEGSKSGGKVSSKSGGESIRAAGDFSPIATFKGWVKPGVIPPGVEASGLPGQDESLDALCGHFRIFQLAHGNKYTTDDVLAAWYGSSWCPSASRVLDLGSGIGSIGMMCAWRLPHARIVSIEAQSVSVSLARKSVLYNGLSARYQIREGDLRDHSMLAPSELFDLITASPPYFSENASPGERSAASSHPQKHACRFELRGGVQDYCFTAARHLAPGGVFVLVFPIAPDFQLKRVLKGAQDAGLTLIRRRPVVFLEGEAEVLGLFLMCRTEHVPQDFRTWTEPVLTIRQKNGQISEEYAALKLALGMAPR